MRRDVMDRRRFLESAVAMVAVSRLGAQAADTPEWGGPVLDIHLHVRPASDGNFNHIQGSGVTRAVLLTNVSAEDHAKAVAAAYPILYKSGLVNLLIRMPDRPVVRKTYHWIYDKFRKYKDSQLYGMDLESANEMEGD